MLHITNGDSIAGSLIQSAVPGEKLAFREDLTSGPTPAGLSTSEWLRLRAEFLTQAYQPADRNCLQELTGQQASLESHAQHQETVLWFAHDLNCQIHLISVLNLLDGVRSSMNKVSLICIGEFPGVDPFICLGQLDPEKLESLFDSRHEVTSIEFDLARKAWSAYCSSDPSDIEALINSDTRALPFLGNAMRRHLARFPSQRNGLGFVENWALRQLSAGQQKFGPMFARFLAQYPRYGLGDAQFWRVLTRMSDCPQPLTRVTGAPENESLDSSMWGPLGVEITPLGRRVLDGTEDFARLNAIDSWLGGVHLQPGTNEWRLDDETGRLTRRVV
jgi:hypothetical protein